MASQAARSAMLGAARPGRVPQPGTARGRHDGRTMGRALFHLALGVTELLAPDALARLIGLRPSFTTRTATRALGARHLWIGYGTMQAHFRRVPQATSRITVLEASTPDATVAHTTHASAELRTARHTVTIARPASELYAVWRDFANLPAFMHELQAVTAVNPSRSLWVARAAGGATVSWETEIVADVPGELIAWQSVPGAAVQSAGTVRFVPTPSGRTSLVHLSVRYTPSIGALGEVVAKLFRVEPGQQVAADLDAFRMLMDGSTLTDGGVAAAGLTDPQRDTADVRSATLLHGDDIARRMS